MSSLSPRILCLGRDSLLLSTRRAVLARRFEAVSVASSEEMDLLAGQSFALILLCYTLSDDEMLRAFEAIQQNWPAARIVAMRMPSSRVSIAADCYLDSLSGPLALLETVEALLHPQAKDAPEAGHTTCL